METLPSDTASFASQLLIAMPHLEESGFSRSLVYLCDHDATGVMGLVVNKPSSLTLGDLFDQLEIECDDTLLCELPVLTGGPVQQDAGFVLHEERGDWDATYQVGSRLYLTGSIDILRAIAEHKGPDHFLVMKGYAGWGEGQLEAEINANSWLIADSQRTLLFNCPYYARWEKAAKSLGIDINLLSREAGHA